MEKWHQMAPNGGREDFFPTNPDLANILGRMDFHFDSFYFFMGGSQYLASQAWVWARLGPVLGQALAGLCQAVGRAWACLLYTSPSPRDRG